MRYETIYTLFFTKLSRCDDGFECHLANTWMDTHTIYPKHFILVTCFKYRILNLIIVVIILVLPKFRTDHKGGQLSRRGFTDSVILCIRNWLLEPLRVTYFMTIVSYTIRRNWPLLRQDLM